jgi:hypothetical protein
MYCLRLIFEGHLITINGLLAGFVPGVQTLVFDSGEKVYAKYTANLRDQFNDRRYDD